MSWITPRNLILIGLVLMLTGVILPLLMVIKVVESTFFWNFFAYISSTIGMIVGIIGVAFYARLNKQ